MPRRLLTALVCCALWGCAADPEPAPEPAPEPTVRDTIPPTDNPPLSGPRPKLIPGEVVEDDDIEEEE